MTSHKLDRNRRILVIDDNQAIHEDFRKVLAQSNDNDQELADAEAALFGDTSPVEEVETFEVDSAFQGIEGLEMVRKAHRENRPYAMAFVDIRMPPGWDGVETIEHIWKEFPGLQVVICTAYSDYSWKMIVSRLRQRENLLILKKPFDATEVLQLAYALTEKWNLARQAELKLGELEGIAQERMSELQIVNNQLRDEIKQRMVAESRMRYEAFHDSLTDLPNRALIHDRLQGAIERSKRNADYRFAVLFLDLDRFKTINDSLGHEFGDGLLRTTASRLQEGVRNGDLVSRSEESPTVARLGGDEFVVLLENIRKPRDVVATAERLLEQIRQPVQLGEHSVRTTASIGIVVNNDSYIKANEMLRDADTAMYQAKAESGARFVMFDASMQTAIQNRLQLESDLRDGIGTDQFFLVYQPIVSLENGSIRSVEALVRWNHPTRGLIAPNEFIPIAEESSLILPLSDWILKRACSQFIEWRREIPLKAPEYISVNLSRLQLTKLGLVEQIGDTLRQAGMRPDQLQLEVTESMIMEDPRMAKQMLSAMKDLGIRLAIDDFGTGHSSLSCLYDFRLDVLKIDRSFIANFELGSEYLTLANSVVNLAQNLSLDCVAEGVEQKYQGDELIKMGCTLAQGYFYGRPVPADEFVSRCLCETVPDTQNHRPVLLENLSQTPGGDIGREGCVG